MALSGTITVSTCGAAVLFSSGNTNFRATSLYLYGLTVGNSVYLVTTTAGCSTGYTIAPAVEMQFPILGGIRGFSAIASSAAGSADITYLASR
jgi:hypothetical protein